MKRGTHLIHGQQPCRTAPARTVPASVRIGVRLHHRRLDRELADGCPPDGSDDRAVRAGQLVEVGTRRGLVRSLRRIVAEAEGPPATALGAAVPICRDAVLMWREGLLGLADRLGQPVPVNPCGVARLLALLEHVAWTCGRCGAIALTDDPAVRPT